MVSDAIALVNVTVIAVVGDSDEDYCSESDLHRMPEEDFLSQEAF